MKNYSNWKNNYKENQQKNNKQDTIVRYNKDCKMTNLKRQIRLKILLKMIKIAWKIVQKIAWKIAWKIVLKIAQKKARKKARKILKRKNNSRSSYSKIKLHNLHKLIIVIITVTLTNNLKIKSGMEKTEVNRYMKNINKITLTKNLKYRIQNLD